MGRQARATSLKQVFDETYETLEKRGWTQALDERISHSCLFRTGQVAEGEPCAAGVHILDNEYRPTCEGGIGIARKAAPGFDRWCDSIPGCAALLARMQEIHDTAAGPTSMKQGFDELRALYTDHGFFT